MRIPLLLLAIAWVTGCSQPDFDKESTADVSLFNATSMRIHPIFTQVKDFNNDSKPDGFEVLMDFQDQFGDPSKAAGSIMFEAFVYVEGSPDPRGIRLANPWIGSMATLEDQRARWNRTSRTYTFQLAYPAVDADKSYVLTATFRSATGGRLFDRVVLEGADERKSSTVKPATQPATKPAP
jgi:hypothetical protein